MNRPSTIRAIVTGFLLAVTASILIHLYYQFLIYDQHRGDRALAHYAATGKVDAATFGSFGYKGWVTTMDLPLDDNGRLLTTAEAMERQEQEGLTRTARNVVVVVEEDGTITPVTFDLSYASRMVVKWHRATWLGFGIVFAIAMFAALRLSHGMLVVSTSGWFLVVFGLILMVGAFVWRGYLGLDGLGRISSIQVANRVAGPVIAMLGFWLTTQQRPRPGIST